MDGEQTPQECDRARYRRGRQQRTTSGRKGLSGALAGTSSARLQSQLGLKLRTLKYLSSRQPLGKRGCMPHGALTPLGKQLRSVLTTLRPSPHLQNAHWVSFTPPATNPSAGIVHVVPCSLSTECRLAYHTSGRRGAATAATAAAVAAPARPNEDRAPGSEQLSRTPGPDSEGARQLKKRRTRRDHIRDALALSDDQHVVLQRPSRRLHTSHSNATSRNRWAVSLENEERHRTHASRHLPRTGELSLERIIANYLQHANAKTDTGQAEWTVTPFTFADEEVSYLRRRGYDLGDVRAWARIITVGNSVEAANMIAERVRSHGPQALPLKILLYVLRRSHLNAAALRQLLEVVPIILEQPSGPRGAHTVPENALVILLVRLLRHAREVWPAAIDPIAELFLRHLPKVFGDRGTLNSKQIESLTYILNEAMHLVSLETAIEPYRDVTYQEAAIVRILRFMAEHRPPLQLNRGGYRAVVRVQLAQKKTPDERQWAELKALSWPPWKQERTAMDADITVEQHGVSRAALTLRRMYEAGYAPLNWEKTAQLYAGWDTDGTPTIQTRVLLGTASPRVGTPGSIWVARISTTRTAQEAWAAYLAYEDAKLTPNSDVYLAVFRKLHEEEKRQRADAHPSRLHNQGRERILPGDKREVEPLPPSTHLYTYTRTPVPSVEAFFRQLADHNVSLGDHCLAYIVAHASSLQLGVEYLRAGQSRYPAIRGLFMHDPTVDLSSIPMPLFTAFIELLCRHSNVSLDKIVGRGELVPLWKVQGRPPLLEKQELNVRHPLVHAMELLSLRRTTFRPAWNHVLRALSRDATLKSMRFLHASKQSRSAEDVSADYEVGKGAILAYRLVRRLLSMLQEIHVNLDETGLHFICLAAENMSVACWKILKDDTHIRAHGEGYIAAQTGSVSEANELLRSSNHATKLKGLFRTLVGDADAPNTPSSAERLPLAGALEYPTMAFPRLLHTPSPALLHAYVRALGWMGDYDGLLSLLAWMADRRTVLADQRHRHRNGEELMRRTVIAVRVFLERSWLADAVDEDGCEQMADRRIKNLRRLASPASRGVVREAAALVDSVEGWGGWPGEQEVEEYCRHARFQEIRSLYLRTQ